jgi:hypothetical protein
VVESNDQRTQKFDADSKRDRPVPYVTRLNATAKRGKIKIILRLSVNASSSLGCFCRLTGAETRRAERDNHPSNETTNYFVVSFLIGTRFPSLVSLPGRPLLAATVHDDSVSSGSFFSPTFTFPYTPSLFSLMSSPPHPEVARAMGKAKRRDRPSVLDPSNPNSAEPDTFTGPSHTATRACSSPPFNLDNNS